MDNGQWTMDNGQLKIENEDYESSLNQSVIQSVNQSVSQSFANRKSISTSAHFKSFFYFNNPDDYSEDGKQ